MGGLLRLSPGDVFAGDFEVRRIVAEGGMGAVYAVLDRPSGQELALKVLLPELVADERSRRRFTQEARVAAELRSPYVPRIHRSGIDPETAQPFIAMELLKGRDLRAHVDAKGAVGLEEARPILMELAEALGAAHRMGLVHRDLKPENVFLEDIPGGVRVKLLDFGVAKILDVHRTSATGTGAVGSPMWMAPEQTSAGGRIAPATDIWAFGLLSFYVLSGTFYWRSMHDGSGIGGLLREMHVDDIAPPSARVAELGLGVTLPAGYDAFFLRAVSRDGAARYRDADELLPALRALLTPPPTDRSAMAFAATVEVSSDEVRAAAARLRSGPPASGLPSAGGGTAPMGSVARSPDASVERSVGPAWGEPPEAWSESSRSGRGGPVVAWDSSYSHSGRSQSGLSSPGASPSARPGSVPAPASIPRTDPPPAIAPVRRASPLAWVAAVFAVGVVVAILSAMIVWMVLTVTEPSRPPRPTAPREAPTPTEPTPTLFPEPLQPLETPVPPG